LPTGQMPCMFVYSIGERRNTKKPISCKNQNPVPKNQSKIQKDQVPDSSDQRQNPISINPVKSLKICTY
jgi:hypothetical protein